MNKPTISCTLEIDHSNPQLGGKRAAMVLFSYYPSDPRPRRTAEALVGCGMSVDLICLREGEKDRRRECFNGVNIRRVPISRRRGGVLGYLYQYCAFLFLSSLIILLRSMKCRYDLIYVNNMPDFLALCGLIPKIFGAKIILDLHDPMPELMRTIFNLEENAKSVRLLKHLEKWSIAIVDSVITVNQACAKLFASRSCRPGKITVVMNSPDERIFRYRPAVRPSAAGTERRPFIVMYHGSLVERNGLDLAVDAFARVYPSIPNADLRIYGGRNDFLDSVMASVRERGLENSVRYMGPKPLEQIVEAIEQCDLGLIPNRRNIFTEINTPTRIFEYLALGKPVIAPRTPGICDYFNESSMLFFELGNAEDLARQIEYAYHHPAEIAEIALRGQAIHRKHMWSGEKSGLTALVSRLLSHDKHSNVAAANPVSSRSN